MTLYTLKNKTQGKIENKPKSSTLAERVTEEPSERHVTWKKRSSVFLLQLSVEHRRRQRKVK